ncbi:MAG: ComEC/Rec2 family competence protein [Anaerolineaceae bacterium]|nr:ComEC/Rec2 family competence protein [Anaerolineaceae bacterium]
MPLLWLSVAFMAGITIGSTVSLGWPLVAVGFLLGVGAGCLERRRFAYFSLVERWQKISPVPAGFLLAAVMAGALRYQVSIPAWTETDLAWYNDAGAVQVRGWISAPPDERDRIDILEISAEEIVLSPNDENKTDSIAVNGKLIAMVRAGRSWQYGDEVLLTGLLATPPENEEFSYREYLARHGVYSYLGYPQMKKLGGGRGNLLMKATTALRDRAYVFINSALPQPEASLLAGILLGIETDIPANVEDAFQETGTTHIIAISGFNIAILAGLFINLSSRFFSKRWAPWIALAGISFYTVLVGSAPPVVRAAVMGGVGLFGKMFGRRQTGANSLTFTAAVMCLFNPDLLWDAGFQLSFAATLGLVLYADPLQSACERLAERWFSQEIARRIAAPISEYFLFTLAAQVTTLPIIAWHFHRVSLSSMLANPLILPPQPLVMICGGLAVLVGLIFPWAGRLAMGLTWPLLAYTIHTVELLARLPRGSLGLGRVSIWGVAGFYLLLLGLTLGWKKLPKPRRPVMRWMAASLVILLAAALAWQPVLTAPDGRLHVLVLGVDEGPALLVQGSRGSRLMINGGARASQLSDALGRRLPFQRRSLDGLLLVPGSASSLEGLSETVARFPAQAAYISGDLEQWQSGRRLMDDFAVRGLPVHDLSAGERISLDEETVIQILAVTPKGTALFIEQDSFRLLIPGGVSLYTLQQMGRTSSWSAVLLCPADLEMQSPAAWQGLAPGVILLAEPVPGVPGELPWLHLGTHQWLEMITDGEQMWINAGK